MVPAAGRTGAHGWPVPRLPPDPTPRQGRHRRRHGERITRRRCRAAAPRVQRGSRAAARPPQPARHRPVEPLLRDGPLPGHDRLPAVGPSPPPWRLLADSRLVHRGHHRRTRDPRRLSTRAATHAPRQRFRRHVARVWPAHLQHRHHRVGRQPVRGDAVTPLRLGAARCDRVRRHQAHEMVPARVRASGGHPVGDRRHRQPLLARRRRGVRAHRRRRRGHPLRPGAAEAAELTSAGTSPGVTSDSW